MSLGKRELSAVLLVFGAVISVYMALLAGPISAQDDCTEVASIGPETTDQRIGPFEVTGDAVRVSGEARSLDPGISPIFNISLVEEGGRFAGGVSINDEGSFQENILIDEPGSYNLEIELFSDTEYTITAEDCGESPLGGNGDTVSDNITVQDDDGLREELIIDKPNNREPTVINIPNKPLPPTGGLPVYGMIAGSILAGAGLLGLGVGIRRGQRR